MRKKSITLPGAPILVVNDTGVNRAVFCWRKLLSLAARMLLLFAWVVTGQAADRDAPVHHVDGSFVREWLVLGPFPGRDLETDFLADVGGETNVRPKEGDTVRTKEGNQLVWTRLSSQRDVIDLEAVFGLHQWAVAYAYCELNSDESISTDARVPVSRYPARLWLNGKKAGEPPSIPERKDELTPTLPIRLNQGRNPGLLKLRVDAEPPWTFAFQPLHPDRAKAEFLLSDARGRPVSGAVIQVYDRGELLARMSTDASGRADVCLYPLAESYDFRLTSGELGTWLSSVVFLARETRKIEVILTNAVSISGRTLTMNGAPQRTIVVQAVRVAELPIPGSGIEPPAGVQATPRRRPIFTWEPQLNDGQYTQTRSLLPMPAFSETILSDTNGNFRFVNLRPGQYHLRAHGSGGYVYPGRESGPGPSSSILVESGQTRDGIQFEFAEAKKGVWTRYPIRDGLTELQPRSIHRTPDGMLWVGTDQRTLHSYDGVDFKIFAPPQIRGSYVQAIHHDAKGTLWIATEMGIGRLSDGKIQTPAFIETLPFKNVGSIAADPDGTVWFSTHAGLCKYDGREFRRWTLKEGIPTYEVGALLRTRDGGLWMSTARSLARFDGQSFSEPVLLNAIRSSGWERLHQARDGAIWFCSPAYGTAAFRYDGRTLSRLGEAEGLSSDWIYDIAETSDGVLWFATAKGISRFDGTTVFNYTMADGLCFGNSGSVADLYVDADDVLWCAGRAGVSRFDPKTFSGITIDDGLRNKDNATPGIFAIEPNENGGYRLGTEWGGVRYLSSRGDQLSPNSILPDEYVRHIQRAADGTLLFGTSHGIYRQAGESITKILNRDWIIAMTDDDPGYLWFGQGWIGGGLSRFNLKTGEETVFTKAQGLLDDEVWALERGLDGSIWIGTTTGLGRFRDGKIENVGEKLGMPLARVTNLRRDADGILWIGSGAGLHRLQGTNLTSVVATNAGALGGVWCSARSADGVLWIGTDKNGLLGFDGQVLTMIDKRDGLLGTKYSL